MKIARVIGQVVSTVEHKDFQGWKLLMVLPLDAQGRPAGESFVAVDAAQAGLGDQVLVMEEGKGARQIMKSATAPCEAVIAGVIDHVQMAPVAEVSDRQASGRPRRRSKP